MTTTTTAVPPGSWLLLVHQLPPKPDYLRVKVGRRLRRVGAVAIKNSVYAIPSTDQTIEDFEWLVREIVNDHGEAFVCRARFITGITDDDIRERFVEARAADYAEIVAAARQVFADVRTRQRATSEQRRAAAAALARLEARLSATEKIDFFRGRALREAREQIARVSEAIQGVAGPSPEEQKPAVVPHGQTWVTRSGIFVDRIASAWLIRRFIDAAATFKFVPPRQQQGYRRKPGEIRFDMSDAEYTHEGDDCTFETLRRRFDLSDPALAEIAQIVHDIDMKDDKFARAETVGIQRVLAGVAAAHDDDQIRLDRGAQIFDELFALFQAEQERR